MQKTKFYATFLVLVILVGIFSLSPALSSLMNSVVVRSTGQISTGAYAYAKSGSARDIQAAVNSISSSGGTVYIPAGTFYWNGETVTIPGGVNVIGASPAGCMGHENNWTHYTASTILHNNAEQDTYLTMFFIDGNNGRSTRISGIQFEAIRPSAGTDDGIGAAAISTTMLKNFRIDHCTFINFADTALSIDSDSGYSGSVYCSYGVIDHCVVDNPYKLTPGEWAWGYGFYSRGNMKPGFNNWDADITHFAGVYGAVTACTIMYVEDCHMSRCRHATDAIQGSWNVIRYNLVDNAYPDWGDIGNHGSQSWYSSRGMEVYNNLVYGKTPSQNLGGIRLRGGSGIIFNNTVIYDTYSTSNTLIVLDDYDYSTRYPFTNINRTYIWSNININCTAIRVLQGVQNVNYFLRAPNQQQDGFTYTPYPYPHPLTTQP